MELKSNLNFRFMNHYSLWNLAIRGATVEHLIKLDKK